MAENIGAGLSLAYGSTALAGAPVYTPIGYITGCTPPGAEADDVEVTSSTSLATSWVRKFIKGLADGGEVEADALFNFAEYMAVYALVTANNSDVYAIKVTLPGEGTLEFDGYFKGLDPEAEQDDAMRCSITIKVSGPLTDAAAA